MDNWTETNQNWWGLRKNDLTKLLKSFRIFYESMSQNSFVQDYFEAFIDYIRKGKKHYFYQISPHFKV